MNTPSPSRRLRVLFLCMACLVVRAPAGDFLSQPNPDGSLTLAGRKPVPEGVLDIPARLNGKPVTQIGYEAFADSIRLTEVRIPDSVTRIDSEAFAYCSGLTNVWIGTGVTQIEEWAFRGCTGLAAVNVVPGNSAFSSVDGVLFNRSQTRLILFPAGKTGHYEVPGTVTEIAGEAFARCTGLTNIYISGSVTTIGNWAFDRTGLQRVSIPDSVSFLGTGAFSGCKDLATATLGTGLREIAPRTFERTGLFDIDLPDNISRIGDWAFYFCPRLARVALSSGTLQIGDRAFLGCSALPAFAPPEGLQELGDFAFGDCMSLTNAVLPASLRRLGEAAFSDCPALTEVVFRGDAPQTGPDLFLRSEQVTVRYAPGTRGWPPLFGDRPAAAMMVPEPGEDLKIQPSNIQPSSL